jgi:hypothetical protein
MPAPLKLDSRTAGVALAFAGFALLWADPPFFAAIGLECVAAAFWLWARAADDAEGQLRRWSWLRRPATAMWIAVAAHAILPLLGENPFGVRAAAADALRLIESAGVVWAALELLAALPVARPFADVAGPLLAMRPWLPAALPAAGFALLWRQHEHWIHVAAARETAIALLLLTAWLGALRATSRRQWRSGLRWLLVSDSALAGVLVALGVVTPLASLLLWLAACGGRAYLLAGELRGASPRRGPLLSRLWRSAMAVASASLAFPVLIALGIGPGGQARALYYLAAAVPVALGAALTTRRHVEAPERRLVMRPHPPFTLGHGFAMATLLLGPLALLIAWWHGFEASLPALLLAVIPVALGAGVAMPGRDLPLRGPARGFARVSFRFVVGRERWLVGLVVRLARGLSAPLRDLHTGDPQEYLLFVIAVAVFALVIPLLR